MSEVEKQESQKTVVAFIAGLLIGGLLVWVFSAPAEQHDTITIGIDEDMGMEHEDTEHDDTPHANTSDVIPAPPAPPAPNGIGNGAVVVSNQSAGSVVALDEVTYPTTDGWIGVRDYVDGTPGRVLGAARYSTTVGLTPDTINLLRATEAGNTYQVVFYTENGDRVFDLAEDTEMEGTAVMFTAK